VVDKLVYLNVGKAGLALDAATGKTVWDSGAEGAAYASPVLCTLGKTPALLIFAGKALVAVNPSTGQQLWQHPWDTKYDVNAADPIVSGNRVFISSNYGRGCAMLEVSDSGAKVLWENKVMKNHFNMSVTKGDLIFGNSESTFVCMSAKDGAELWQRSGFGKGHSVLLVGDKLLILSERGQLTTAEAKADGLQPLANAQILGGQCWTTPAVADGRIYIRNNTPGQLVCVDLN
jgi:outer membrane protein assembly factor BamB